VYIIDKMTYSLKSIPQIDSLLTDETNRKEIAKSLNLKHTLWKHKNGCSYNILKYEKDWLSKELVKTVGLLRSLIYKNDGTVVCFAPPKSLPVFDLTIDKLEEETTSSSDQQSETNEEVTYTGEDYVEGTMINTFYDEESCNWEFATRSSVGGDACFFMENGYKKENTFKYMFEETCNKIGLDLNLLNKKYIYSFVIQHPRNRIVKIINEMQLYLVEVYEIVDNATIHCIPFHENEKENLGIPSTIQFPNRVSLHTNEELANYIHTMASSNTEYQIVGVMIKNSLGDRYKIRNPNYEHVRRLRGNQPKLQFHYMTLRKSGQVGEYLRYYGEHKDIFQQFRTIIHDYTTELFTNYIRCYIKKEKPITEFPEKFRTHMYSLHRDVYLKQLRPQQRYMNKPEVIQYFNNLPSAKQMFIVNYDVRKQFKDAQKNNLQKPDVSSDNVSSQVSQEEKSEYVAM